MGCSESELACKKHQNLNNQLQGVCPFCLRERLSQLLCNKRQTVALMVAAPSCSSSFSSLSPSGASYLNDQTSPPLARPQNHHHRNVSEVMMGSMAFMLSAGNGLKKSRSIGFVPRNFGGELKSEKKKKKGFWSRLLHLERKKENLMHSRTVSERL